jgi:hypothetical protein
LLYIHAPIDRQIGADFYRSDQQQTAQDGRQPAHIFPLFMPGTA